MSQPKQQKQQNQYSLPSVLGDDYWKREFIHEIDLMINEIKMESRKLDDAANKKSQESKEADSFSQKAMKTQQNQGRQELERREAEEKAKAEAEKQEQNKKNTTTSSLSISPKISQQANSSTISPSQPHDVPVKKKSKGFLSLGKK